VLFERGDWSLCYASLDERRAVSSGMIDLWLARYLEGLENISTAFMRA
jgi:hypothetical protein